MAIGRSAGWTPVSTAGRLPPAIEASAPRAATEDRALQKKFQVGIVGGGPVGVALALDLGLRGISCALVETRPGLSSIPKGQNLTQRTLEHFYFWGLADELRAARLMPKGYPIGELTAYGSLASGYWQAPAGRELVRDFYYQANERLPQYRTEEVLRRKLATLANVEVKLGWTAKSISQDADGVHVTVAEEKGPGRAEFDAEYVVGCDGGHSMVRNSIGIARGGTDFDQKMALIVFRSKELHEKLKMFPERSTYRVMHPDYKGYWQFFGRIDVGEGFFFHSPVPASSTKENFDFHALLEKSAGFRFAAEFDHVGFWDLRVAVAEKYQVGRVLIAGDAAHSHPPYGGYGLNNGLEDVANVGWKLAARLEGWGGDKLIESYSEERRPIFHEVAEDFIAERIRIDGAFLARYNPAKDKAAFEKEWNARETDVGSRAKSYEPNYEGSSVIAGPPGSVSSAHGTHMYKARAGHHLTPQVLSSGKNVFEELWRGFTLLAFDAGEEDVHTFEAAAASLKVPFKTVRDTYQDRRTAYEARMIFVRPDQFVVWCGDVAPEDTLELMKQAVGI
jgi:2-polyprenyl-6-methoxyphenol hydroxylase-like FAD-dependent oxidoreductase